MYIKMISMLCRQLLGVISCYSGAISCYRTISHPGLIPGGPKGSNLAPGGTAPLWIKTVA